MLTHDEPVELTRFNQVLDQFTDRSDVLLETLERLAEALHRFAFAQELAAIRSDYDAYEFELEEVDATVDTEAVRALDECLAEAQYHLRRVVACGKKIEEGVVTSSFSLEIRARTAEPFTALFPHLTQLRHALRRARDYTADTPFASRAQRLVLARIRELDEKRLEPLAQSLRPALAAFVARSVSDQNHDVAAAALHSLQALASLSERVDMIARRVEAARCADEASLRELAAVTAHIARSLETFSSNPLIWTFLQ